MHAVHTLAVHPQQGPMLRPLHQQIGALRSAARRTAAHTLFTLVTVQVLVSSAKLWIAAQDEKARNDRGSDSTEKAVMIIAAITIAGIIGWAVTSYVESRTKEFKPPTFDDRFNR